MVHNTVGGGQDDETELTGRQKLVDPVLHLSQLHVEAGRNDAALVQATVQVDNDLAGAVVVDDLEFVNVTVLLHDTEELDDDLGGRADKDLALAAALGIGDALESIVQHANTNHLTTKVNDPFINEG